MHASKTDHLVQRSRTNNSNIWSRDSHYNTKNKREQIQVHIHKQVLTDNRSITGVHNHTIACWLATCLFLPKYSYIDKY